MLKHRTFAKTPPMGWNSWDCFGPGITEEQLKENADYMAEHLKEFGWDYVVCDIQWYEPKAKGYDYNPFARLEMDKHGRLMPSPKRFPSAAEGKGFKPIADYVHSLGLKFGIHIMRGVPRQAVTRNCKIAGCDARCKDIAHTNSICSWNTDMYGVKNTPEAQQYYNSIIDLYAQWGVDFIKCDDICITEYSKHDNPYSAAYEIEMIRKAIDNCGRDIVLSLSPGPALRSKAEHLKQNANMWRLTGDFWDNWSSLYAMFDKCEQWQGVSRPGNWPDCDMLPVGRLCKNGSCNGPQDRMTQFTHSEQKTMMTLWGIFKSPLMIGGNLPECDKFTLNLLTNKAFLEMHRTSYGARQIFRKERNGKGTIIWSANGKECKYIAIFNTDDKKRVFTFDLRSVAIADTPYTVYDIWKKETCYDIENFVVAELPAHGVKLIKISSK